MITVCFALGFSCWQLTGIESAPVSAPTPLAPKVPGNPPPTSPALRKPLTRPSLWQGAPNLTESQRAAVRSAREENLKASAPIREKMTRARKELEEYLFLPTSDSVGIKAKVSEIGQHEAALAELRHQFIGKLRPVLSAEQLERLHNNRGEWAEQMTRVPPNGTNGIKGSITRSPRLQTLGAPPPVTSPAPSAPRQP